MNNEIWKDIDGYEKLYKISNYGRIKSLYMWDGHKYIKKEHYINPYISKSSKNYFRNIVKLCKNGEKKDFKVHQLVAKAFIPNPMNYKIVNHKDGNPLNNYVSNLEWCTQKENVKHAIKNELTFKTINSIDRDDLLELLNSGRNYDEIAKILNIGKGTVFNYIKKFDIRKKYM